MRDLSRGVLNRHVLYLFMNNIVIDLTPIQDFLALPPDLLLLRLLILFGWIPLVLVFLWGGKEIWMFYIKNTWAATQKYIFLAIDIPKGNEQSPKAVEHIFAYLAGAHGSLNLIEVYWEGKFQLSFSFEVVSIEGYTQFVIRTPVQFRNLVESAIYSQYPDAEIAEIDDYAQWAPTKFPDEEYDVWGADYIETKHWVYPFRTYEEFEQQSGDSEIYFKDPMATLMDLGSSLIKGEQLWFQIICVPQGFDWMEEGDKEIRRILGEKVTSEHLGDKIVKTIVDALADFSEVIIKLWGDIKDKEKDSTDDALKMMNLKPQQKKQVEAITRKVSKNGYKVKVRMVYVARKEVFNKAKVVAGFTGFMKQFSDLDLNNFKPDTELTQTTANYLFKEGRLNRRKMNIVANYKARDAGAGRTPGIMNTEELATLWHFPVESAVKAPMIQKTPGKKSEAPMSLPVGEEIVSEDILAPIFEDESEQTENIDQKIEARGDQESKNALVDFGVEDEISEEKASISVKQNSSIEKKQTNGTPPPNLPFA